MLFNKNGKYEIQKYSYSLSIIQFEPTSTFGKLFYLCLHFFPGRYIRAHIIRLVLWILQSHVDCFV